MDMVLSKLDGMHKHVRPENEFLGFYERSFFIIIAGSFHLSIYLLATSYRWLIGLAMLLGLCGIPTIELLFIL
jgi:hypothetical protein